MIIVDAQDEIFDMVKPANPNHITLQDLISRYCSATVRIMKLFTVACKLLSA